MMYRISLLILCLVMTARGLTNDTPLHHGSRQTENFDHDWKFERFGPMPDGSYRNPPGTNGWKIKLTASSFERNDYAIAERAMDGRKDNFWGPDPIDSDCWIEIDTRPIQESVASLDIHWGRSAYKHLVVSTSNDHKKWSTLTEVKPSNTKDITLTFTDKAQRYIRIAFPQIVNDKGRVERKGFTLREITLRDKNNNVISNELLKNNDILPQNPKYDDSAWRTLSLPHDWGIEGPFRQDLANNTGKLPWRAIGYYRKKFTIAANDKGKNVFIDFDGAMSNSEVWLNGHYIGEWPYGYTSFRHELTKHIKYGEENILCVRLDTVNLGSRWYPGAGIYRHVRLVKTDPVHIPHWGTKLTSPVVTADKAQLHCEVKVQNDQNKGEKVKVQTHLYNIDKNDIKGKLVTSSTVKLVKIPAGSCSDISYDINVKKPLIWDIKHPHRYLCETVVTRNGKVCEKYVDTFGFRTISFTPKGGFQLNGRRVQVQGVCQHHDLGALGSAVNTRAVERQVEILQEMGINSIRTAHNPSTPELIDVCDKLGILVQVEAFDCWQGSKRSDDYGKYFAEWNERDIEAMVCRDRNHPSVFMWSTGNEVLEQHGRPNRASTHGLEMTRHLRDTVRLFDTTRPVMVGCNNGNASRNGFHKENDVHGFNYNLKFYEIFDKENHVAIGSETSSSISSRGVYNWPTSHTIDYQIPSYDNNKTSWGCIPDTQFKKLEQNPHIIGEFVWTGFDYIGEPTPFNSDSTNLLNLTDPVKREKLAKELERLGRVEIPSRSSYFGIIDLAGFKKDRFYSYQSQWRPDFPMAHIFPHWTHDENRIGEKTPVHVYSSGNEAELFVNGKSQGRITKKQYEYRFIWNDVIYEPGSIEVVVYKDGKEWAKDRHETLGPASELKLEADRKLIRADGNDLSFVTVKVCADNGTIQPNAHNMVQFNISGPGEIIAVDNGDPTSHEPFQANYRKAFHGLCLVVIRSKAGQEGTITLEAKSNGLKSTRAKINSK